MRKLDAVQVWASTRHAEVLTERCVLASQPRVPAVGGINWIGVADTISIHSHKNDSMTDAYAEALSEVIAKLERRLGR